MKQELQDKLVEILDAMQKSTGRAIDAGAEAAGKVGDFAFEQLPDIVQTYVAFERAWTTFGALLWWSVFALLMWLLVVKVIKNDK